MNYVPLNIKTENSLLSSFIRIPALIKKAKELGYKILTITDPYMFGAIEFYRSCMENGIKPIIGLEIIYHDLPIVLYAKNYHGYQNLIKLSTIMSREALVIEDLASYREDVICILPFASRSLENTLKDLYYDFYFGYSSEEEYILLKDKKTLFMQEIRALSKEDTSYLRYLEAIRDGKVLSDTLTDYTEFYLKTIEEYQNLDYDFEENCNLFATISIDIPKRDDLLPLYDTKGIDPNQYLKEKCIEGLKKRFGESVPRVYVDRLKYELQVISNMGFSNYFLVVADYVAFARKNGILVGPGRGSAAGSLVSYVLHITDIDPLRYQLLFERFLNPERITMPDIDVDFLDARRDEVIDYCMQKYGMKHSSGIIAFGTLASKQAIRDVFRTLELESDTLSKMITSKLTLQENLEGNPKLRTYLERHPKAKMGYKVAMALEGLKRHTSIHAAGIVISSHELDEVLPLYYHDDRYLTAYDMNYLEGLGLLKMDFLGIKNLNIIDRVLKDLEQDGIYLSLDKISLDDAKTLKIFEEVNTIGIFQFESAGMMNFLRKFKPKKFEEIYACLALYRPGPMGNIDTYIRRKEGLEKVNYYDPTLEAILKPTYGILIYQEQIMQVAHVMADYTLGEADILRRAMSKKKEAILLAEKEKFINRAIKKGYTEKVAHEVYELILKFASYGFNKAHSVAYAMISYQMAYLKAYYPAYFMRGLLDISIGSSTATKDYIYEAKKNHIMILKPDINLSEMHYKIENGCIRYPLYNIKNVGIAAAESILEERKKGPFKDIYDFVSRTYSKAVNTQTLTSLIQAGCFDSLGMNRKTLLSSMDVILNYAEVLSFLDPEYALKPVITEEAEYSKKTLMSFEAEVFGFYLSMHPVTEYRLDYQKPLTIEDAKKYFDKNVELIARVRKVKEIKTKKGDIMGFLDIEDEMSMMDVVLFPKVYETVSLEEGNMILLLGKVEKRFDKYQIVASKIKILDEKSS